MSPSLICVLVDGTCLLFTLQLFVSLITSCLYVNKVCTILEVDHFQVQRIISIINSSLITSPPLFDHSCFIFRSQCSFIILLNELVFRWVRCFDWVADLALYFADSSCPASQSAPRMPKRRNGTTRRGVKVESIKAEDEGGVKNESSSSSSSTSTGPRRSVRVKRQRMDTDVKEQKRSSNNTNNSNDDDDEQTETDNDNNEASSSSDDDANKSVVVAVSGRRGRGGAATGRGRGRGGRGRASRARGPVVATVDGASSATRAVQLDQLDDMLGQHIPPIGGTQAKRAGSHSIIILVFNGRISSSSCVCWE
jgi:hypothetical protein